MTTARYNHTATLLQSGEVLITGGSSSDTTGTPLASAELYDPASGSFIPIGEMTSARANHTATLLVDGKVLITGGTHQPSAAKDSVTATAEVFDPIGETFAATGSMLVPREFHTATRLDSGEVLVIGGDDGINILASTEVYDPPTSTFGAAAVMSEPREYFPATLLGNGNVLVAGGLIDLTEGATTAMAEVYKPTFTVKITAPATAENVSGTVSIVTDVTASVSWINIYIDGDYLASSPPYSFNWNSTAVADGLHTISTRAFAKGGTQVGSYAISVSVRN
jgi:hypothetical protein